MLVKAEPAVDQEADIVLHPEIDYILQGHDGQRVGVRVICAVDRIVEGQKLAFLPKKEAEKMVLELAVQVGAAPWKQPVQNSYEIVCSH